GVRSLGQCLQESVCFSHDVQGGLGGVQPLVCASEFAGEPRDLGLFGGEPANLLAGPFARQHPGVALLAPFADQRRIQALPPQIGAAFTVFARLLIGMQMGNLVRRGERATAPRPVGSGVRWIHRFIVVHRGNRGAGHGVPIPISPCVRPICCEPVDSTHPDTQGAPRAAAQTLRPVGATSCRSPCFCSSHLRGRSGPRVGSSTAESGPHRRRSRAWLPATRLQSRCDAAATSRSDPEGGHHKQEKDHDHDGLNEAVRIRVMCSELETTVMSLGTQRGIRHKIVEWLRRYAPNEIAGWVGQLGAAAATYALTGSYAAAVIAAIIGASAGYYAAAYFNAVRWSSRAHAARSWPMRVLVANGLAARSIAVEFGPAEAIDSITIRPIALYLGPLVVGNTAVGFVLGSIVADIAFYV